LLAAALLAGCGSKTDSAETQRAAEIEQRAMQAENEAARLERERDQQKRIAEAQKQSTVTVPDGALPAGSEEIDGPQGSGSLISAADRASFKRLAAELLGEEGVAITTLAGTPVAKLGSVDGGVAWSTGKVPVAMAAIAAGTAKDSDLRAAITASDNAAAERLWSGLGGGNRAASAATAQLRAAGDTATAIEGDRIRSGYTAFGQTNWKLADQARFVAGMACSEPGSQVLELMGQVSSGQSWGLGDTGLPARFKGGWGPGITPGSGDGWLERQMGILTIKGKPIVVTIASTGPGHEADTITLSRIATWVAEHVDPSGAPMRPSC
jgi:hypothetical protein